MTRSLLLPIFQIPRSRPLRLLPLRPVPPAEQRAVAPSLPLLLSAPTSSGLLRRR